MNKLETRELIRMWIEAKNSRQLLYFHDLNPRGGHYSAKQKEYVIEKATSIGFRTTSRLLLVPRRTIQRWLRAKGIIVKRCPSWVYDWAYWRKKRREKWERIRLYRK